MELSKNSELTVGDRSYVIDTELGGDEPPSISTRVSGSDGLVVFETSQDISSLRPIFQNSQEVFARMDAQHQNIVEELQQGRLLDTAAAEPDIAEAPAAPVVPSETDALEDVLSLLGRGNFDGVISALRAMLEVHPDCSEGRELLEVAYKASSDTLLPIDVEAALQHGTHAFAAGRQREAIESWKQCLIKEPGNRLLQLLVMLATTWSAERRQRYAAEVLAPEDPTLGRGRPAEAQALLLVAQTVEGAPQPSGRPTPTPVSPQPVAPEPASSDPESAPDEALLPEISAHEADGLESLIDEGDSTLVITTEDQQSPPERDVAPPTLSIPPATDAESEAAASTAASPVETASSVGGDDSTESTGSIPPRPPVARRPMGRAKRNEPPWAILGGAAVLVLLMAGGGLIVLSGSDSVPPGRLEQAASFVGNGQYAEAVLAYDGLLQEYGEHENIFEGRGRAKVASSDVEGGLADLKRAYDLDPEATIAEEIGDVYYSSGSYPEAIEFYEKALTAGQGSAEARYRLAVSLVGRGESDDAMEHLRAAISSDPAHGEAHFLYGELLNQLARFAEAEQALRASESHMNASADFLAEMTIALLGQGKLDEAEERARSFIRLHPSEARAHSLLGEVYLSREQYEPARAQLILALRTDRNEPRAQIALGRTWLAIGKMRGDLGDLEKARQVLTGARGVHEGERLLALGQVSLAEGDLETAELLLRRSLEHGAAGLPAHLSLAESKARGDDLAGAAEEIQRASGFAPEDPAISLSLAIAYAQLEQASRAAEQFLKSIQGVGLVTPPGKDAGPVVLPVPYIPIPHRFDVNRAIRNAYESALAERENDPAATELQTLAESTRFVLETS